ncbi:DUF4232 domain-containing protein [Gluconacetobacter azotocaptans]|uniref:DUF4232 domain-containing protein n=1 Tax=Gluconacetobacter azotocaptans TaxID=142834 RepID=UPI0019577210|nr:DUF4232 domain-containing protein [Gluconacetobacter azotocaptans]MBM9400181.1 DUF4232 domain-containing protein [Gluconacetobacter azotocaptans]
MFRPVHRSRRRSATLWALVVLGAGVCGAQRASAAGPVPDTFPDCTAAQLSLGLDDENGQFDGMSQSGTLLVIRNLGPGACAVAALPVLRFEGRDHERLAMARRPPAGMHPGPVLPPVAVAADAELTARLHWVSGDVFDDGHNCVTPDTIVLDVPGGPLRWHFGRQMCAPAHATHYFDQTPLRPDPTLWRQDEGGHR